MITFAMNIHNVAPYEYKYQIFEGPNLLCDKGTNFSAPYVESSTDFMEIGDANYGFIGYMKTFSIW